MINLVLATHGEFAYAALQSAQMITGPEENAYAICFKADESLESLKGRMEELLQKLKGENTIVFTDIKGGTPFNAAYLLSKKYKFSLLSGINMPVLLEALMIRNTCSSMKEMEDKLSEAAKNSIEIIKL